MEIKIRLSGWAVLLLAVVLLGVSPAQAQEPVLAGIANNAGTGGGQGTGGGGEGGTGGGRGAESEFGFLNLETGLFTPVATLPYGRVSAMDSDPTDGTIYATGVRDQGGEDEAGVLFSIECDGTTREIGPTNQVEELGAQNENNPGMTIGAEGTAYATMYDGEFANLITLNKETGEASLIGVIDADGTQGESLISDPFDKGLVAYGSEVSVQLLNPGDASSLLSAPVDFSPETEEPRLAAMDILPEDVEPRVVYASVMLRSGEDDPGPEALLATLIGFGDIEDPSIGINYIGPTGAKVDAIAFVDCEIPEEEEPPGLPAAGPWALLVLGFGLMQLAATRLRRG